MGRLIKILQEKVELISGENRQLLRLGGTLITLILVIICGLTGWFLERLALNFSPLIQISGSIIIIIAMSSTIAAGSLRKSVLDVITALPSNNDDSQLQHARRKLSYIVGRDVWMLNRKEILRATAETASENAVDGIFAPLFWMFIGATLWSFSTNCPGPLSLALVFKATSTIDSMIGYRHGRMMWLGTAGARLDDLLTWLPARAVMLTLPLISKPIKQAPALISAARNDGSKDISPNSGISEAIFAYCSDTKMGGTNIYKGETVKKPILSKNSPDATIESIEKMLKLILKLEITWLTVIAIISLGVHII